MGYRGLGMRIGLGIFGVDFMVPIASERSADFSDQGVAIGLGSFSEA